MTPVAILAACWLAIGTVTAAVMWRRGHDGFGWLLLGVILGPFTPLFAMEAWRRREAVTVVAPGVPGRRDGPVDVLVGIDGSARSAATVLGTVHLLGPRIGRLTVATVVPHDVGADDERMAADALAAVAAGLPAARLEVLHGVPSAALLEHTAEGGYDLLAVGARGAGLGHALVGSTARQLAGTSKVPVLVVGSGESPAT